MGNQPSSHTQAGPGWSVLGEVSLPPEACWELYKGWEIFQIDIELKTLPPHVRDRIVNICVDEYTQEIISCEGIDAKEESHVNNQTCSRCSSGASEDVNVVGDVCSGQDVEGVCLQQSDYTDVVSLYGQHGQNLDDSVLRRHKDLRGSSGSGLCSVDGDGIQKEGSSCGVNYDGGSESDYSADLDGPGFRTSVCACAAVRVNPPSHTVAGHTGSSVDYPRVPQEPHSAKQPSDSAESVQGLDSSNCQGTPCADDDLPGKTHWRHHNRELRCTPSRGISIMQDFGFEGGSPCSEPSSQPAPAFPSSKTDTVKTSHRTFWSLPDDVEGLSPFTTATSSRKFPVRRQSTPNVSTCHLAGRSPTSARSQGRKPSWKEEPGWIPNPLDSDSDQDESEECGVFSKSSHPSKRSSDLPSAVSGSFNPSPTTDVRFSKTARLSERRRCNSEPSSGSSTLSAFSHLRKDPRGSDVSSSDTGARWKDTTQSKWSLWRKNKPQTVDDVFLAPPAEDEEEGDLEKELEWLVADADPETASSQETSSSPEDVNNVLAGPGSLDPPDHTAVDSSTQDPSSLTSSPLLQPTVCRQEVELEWLCEPEWNNAELEVFWQVLRPHLEVLLQAEVREDLPLPRVAVNAMDSSDHTMMDRCLLHVQRHIWTGNYRQAIADFRAVTRHFRSCAEKSGLLQCVVKNDVEILRLVFFRKKPSRYRLWI